jgi:hypothetical protein
MWMEQRYIIIFFHRYDRNGTVASICSGCLATVGTGKTLSEVGGYERRHECSGSVPSPSAQFDPVAKEAGAEGMRIPFIGNRFLWRQLGT